MNAHNEQQALPCPFCGREPDLSFNSVSCGCAASPFIDREDALQVWNTRAAQPSPVVKQNLTTQPAAAQEAVAWLSKDEAQLALFKAIQAIRFGNPTDDKMILDNLRHEGLWIGRYANAPVTAAPVDGRDVRSAIAGLEGSVAVGSDGEWVSVRRAARDAAVMALRNVSLDCAHIYAAYSEAKASTPAAPGTDLTALADRITDHLCEHEYDIGGRDELLRHVREAIDASPKGGSEARALLDALVSLVAVARRYLPDYDEHPEVQKADDAIDAAMQGQAGDAEVQP